VPRRLALLVLALAACGDGPPVWAPTPVPSGPESGGCIRSRELCARVPGLLEEGRVSRAVRVLQRAEDLCPAEAPATWGPRVGALAALGRSAEALQLAARIERSDRASDADRAAAKAARAVAEEHARGVAAAGSRHDDPELYDPAEKLRAHADDLHRGGAFALRAGDAAGAKKLFLEAWSTWHPNPRALIEAGLAAQALGEKAEAQRFWDRALYDDAAASLRPEVPAGAPRAIGGALLAWSAGGDRLAIGGDEEIAVFTGDLAEVLRIHTGEAVTALSFAAGDGLLAAGLSGGKARLYDTVLGTARAELAGHTGALRAIAASRDGKLLATAADDTTVRVWDAATGNAGRALAAPRSALAIAWSSSGSQLAFADDGGVVRVADLASGAVTALPRARGGAVRALAFDGAALFVVTAGERLRYDLARPRNPPRTVARGRADLASFASGGVVAVQDAASLGALDLASGARLAAPKGPLDQDAVAIALSPDRRAIAAVYRDRTIALLPARDGAERRVLGPAAPLAALAVERSGKLLAGASEDGRVLLWSVHPGRLSAFAAPGARALAFSPDGRSLAVGGDRRVELRDLAADRAALTLPAGGRVDGLAFSPDGTRLAVATDAPAVQVFAAGSAAALGDLKLTGGPVRAVRFSPGGKALLLAAKEGVVLWEPETHKGTRFVPYGGEPRDVVFTPDGAGMIVADKRGQLLFGKPAESAPAPAQTLAVATQALALAVAPNGLFVTAEGDRAVTVRGPNGKPIQRYREPEAAVRAVAFLPQGLVAASFFDGAIRLFRGNGPGAVGALRPMPGMKPGALAGVVETPSGHLELVGPDAEAARAGVRCRIGASLYPFDVCAEPLAMTGLLDLIAAGQDPAEAEP